MDWNAIDPERLFATRSASEGLQQMPSAACGRSSGRSWSPARMATSFAIFSSPASVSWLTRKATPRAILERLFRRAVSDREWREEFAPLLS